jgi:transcriptional regulator with XRE-family HTH domain
MGPDRSRIYRTYIAANVRRLRSKAGLTQEKLAEAAGIEPRYLQEVERATSNLTLAVLVGLAEAFEVSPGTLLKPATLVRSRPGRPSGPVRKSQLKPATR